jgi:hypothetical protein
MQVTTILDNMASLYAWSLRNPEKWMTKFKSMEQVMDTMDQWTKASIPPLVEARPEYFNIKIIDDVNKK